MSLDVLISPRVSSNTHYFPRCVCTFDTYVYTLSHKNLRNDPGFPGKECGIHHTLIGSKVLAEGGFPTEGQKWAEDKIRDPD